MLSLELHHIVYKVMLGTNYAIILFKPWLYFENKLQDNVFSKLITKDFIVKYSEMIHHRNIKLLFYDESL